jgi:hypothetical protein
MRNEIKICPRCGSTDLMVGDGTKSFSFGNVCKGCDFGRADIGIVEFPKIFEDEVEEFRNKIRKNQED